jgi:2-polyprenyl-3-methyl-5-hydroxy-6-metoxy-1,4-benzoquinol methylase
MALKATNTERFFERYPRLLETTQTKLLPNRLAARYEIIFQKLDVDFNDKTVLDLGSHDGRWSLAALDAGARRVVGIEGRSDMVDEANKTLSFYGFSVNKFNFIEGDILTILNNIIGECFDIVLNLGFFYHTIQHVEILDRLSALLPKVIITDTAISTHPGRIIQLFTENTADPRMSLDYGTKKQGQVITGRPSQEALIMMMKVYGYDTKIHDWSMWSGPWDGIEDYRDGTRITSVSKR